MSYSFRSLLGPRRSQLGRAALQDSIRAQLEELDLGQLLRFAELLDEDYQELIPSLNWRDLLAGAPAPQSAGDLFLLLSGAS